MKEFRKVLQHINRINEYKVDIDSSNFKEKMAELYRFIKEITPYYYQNKNLYPYYSQIRKEIINIEEMISDQTIIKTEIPFRTKDKNDNLLDQIIRQTRTFLIEEYFEHRVDEQFIKEELNGILNIDFADYCQISADFIQKLCIKNNIKSFTVCIAPAYDKKAEIYNGSGYHFINIINHDNDYYLLDATYQQFFSARSNNLERLGVLHLSGCDVGNFMLLTEEGTKMANEIIQKGYTKLSENLLKTYLDAFTISYRNGLYYENEPDNKYTTDYTFKEYLRFLYGEDSQLNYEDPEYLGFQLKPLKDSKMVFQRKSR